MKYANYVEPILCFKAFSDKNSGKWNPKSITSTLLLSDWWSFTRQIISVSSITACCTGLSIYDEKREINLKYSMLLTILPEMCQVARYWGRRLASRSFVGRKLSSNRRLNMKSTLSLWISDKNLGNDKSADTFQWRCPLL